MYVRLGKKIKRAREELRLSQAELGAILGVTATAINYYEKGKRKINLEDLHRLALALGKPLEFFLDETQGFPSAEVKQQHPADQAEEVHDLVDLPVAGAIPAGSPIMAEQNITGYLPFPRKMAASASFALWVKGNSLVGEGIEEGDLVLIHRQSHVDYMGQIVCVQIDGESTLKIFTRDEHNRIRLKAANPAYPDIVLEDDGSLQVLGVYAGVFKLPKPQAKRS